jgi:DNA modification methylase
MPEGSLDIASVIRGREVARFRTAEPDWLQRLWEQDDAQWQVLRHLGGQTRHHLSDSATYILGDALDFLADLPPDSLHAIVTDPPFGLEYEDKDHSKLRSGRGGVWRIPPAFDGVKRSPLPRFTVLSADDLSRLYRFFGEFARHAERALVPGGHLMIASTPLLSSAIFNSIQHAGLEKRGEIVRLVQTLRGGYKPKGAEDDFPEVSVIPRACWEPWGVFRKPFKGTVADNLRRWGSGGLRRPEGGEPLKDVVSCSPARGRERQIAPHPSLKPQRFLRRIVRASLPLGVGIVFDPFAGSASTLAAAASVGYRALGTDRDEHYLEMGRQAFPKLRQLSV